MAVKKEVCLLKRNFGGLLILFVMPLFLVITVTLIQDSTYKNISNKKIPILIVDMDQNTFSATILDEIKKSESFEIITEWGGKTIDEEQVENLVFKGRYQIGIIIPKNLSKDLQLKIDENVNRILDAFTDTDLKLDIIVDKPFQTKEIRLYFDPALQISFKAAIESAIDKMIAQIETKSIYQAFSNQFSENGNEEVFKQEKFIHFSEIKPTSNFGESIPNSVQHNVPAWTLFAIFFIMVPLSINIIKEKAQGTNIRMMTIPTPIYVIYSAKIIVYLLISLSQFYLIVGVGMYLFPHIGLPKLDVENSLFALTILTLFTGLSAISLGVLLGVIAKTEEQSAPFGATFTVILAAIGGVWIPTFAMPTIMQYVSKISPMNWALDGYYTILLRKGALNEIVFDIILLFLFSMLMITIAIVYDKKKRSL